MSTYDEVDESGATVFDEEVEYMRQRMYILVLTMNFIHTEMNVLYINTRDADRLESRSHTT